MLTTARPPAAKAIEVAAAVLSGVLVTLFYFRVQIGSGMNLSFGDRVDSRIALALEEHWWNVFRGLEQWREPLFFYPARDALGYNDGYFLFGAVYAVFRALGFDSPVAGEAAAAVFRLIAFAGFLLFARRACRLPFGWSVLGAAVFALSNAMYLQSHHEQLLSVGLAPVLALLIWAGWDALKCGRVWRGTVFLCLAAGLLDSWLLTAFYTIWFTGLFTVLLSAGYAVVNRRIGAAPRRIAIPLLLSAAVLLIGAAPFVAAYLPTARETGMHPAAEILSNTPHLLDLVHVGSGNFVWGWLDRAVTQLVRPGFPDFSEQTVGLPPLLWLLAFAGMIVAWLRPLPRDGAWWRPVSLACIVSLMLAVQVRTMTLWPLVLAVAPGAGAVRIVSRDLLFLAFPITLLASYALSRCPYLSRLAICIPLAAFLLAEEVNQAGYVSLDRRSELMSANGVPPPPASCRRFFVQTPRPPSRVTPGWDSLSMNVDGMILAESLHMPTLNGNASFLPAGYELDYLNGADYLARARRFVLSRNLEDGLCGLDLTQMSWNARPFSLAPLAYANRLALGFGAALADPVLLQGWSGAEAKGRWTDGPQAAIGFSVAPAGRDLHLDLDASAFAPHGQASAVSASVNGEIVAEWQPSAALQTLSIAIPRRLIAANGAVRIILTIARPISPAEAGLGADARRLGLFVEALTLRDD